MEWKITPGLTDYAAALEMMAARVSAIQRGEAKELLWLLEHPPLYTLGTSAKAGDVIGQSRFPIYQTGRGGQVTYHGPGQRVVYLMLDLKKHMPAGATSPDLRAYVQDLERWIIATLAEFGIEGFVREGRVGVWVNQSPVASLSAIARRAAADRQSPVGSAREAAVISPSGEARANHESRLTTHEAKIAALGVRVQKWVTSHGIALNVNPDLSHYAGIVPCGIREFGVTSLHALGVKVGIDAVDVVLKKKFGEVFG